MILQRKQRVTGVLGHILHFLKPDNRKAAIILSSEALQYLHDVMYTNFFPARP
jgi:hypothetical protein